jgi:tetratricopeptide (TPR) repeat protein
VSDRREPSSEALDPERAIAAGELTACRDGLRDAALGDAERAAFYCRLGEAFYYRDGRQDAIDCARAAFALAPGQEAVADFCAWLFSNCGCHDEAAAAYRRLLDRRPGWAAGHRHLSGSLAAAGDLDRAIQHAAAACEIDPAAPEFAVHAGGLLASVGLNRDAIEYFSRARALAPRDPGILRHLSSAVLAQGETERALALARQARALAPDERAGAHHLAEMLLRCARFEEAAATISAALGDDDPDARRSQHRHIFSGRRSGATAPDGPEEQFGERSAGELGTLVSRAARR